MRNKTDSIAWSKACPKRQSKEAGSLPADGTKNILV